MKIKKRNQGGNGEGLGRRSFIGTIAGAAAALSAGCKATAAAKGQPAAASRAARRGAQRLSLDRLRQFEALGYGMFISYDIQAFYKGTIHGKVTDEMRRIPASCYAPDKLDVGQWIAVARDAGMKYAVLTAKRHPGFCLWPSRHTDYTVANSGNRTDVVEQYVKACAQCGIVPGIYYPAVDFHHLHGRPPQDDWRYVTSLHQTFITDQITELLTEYGEIGEVWIDIPKVLGRGYRTFLYEHIARLQPNAVILMNSGIQDGLKINVEKVWPTDLISIEVKGPAKGGYQKWRTVEGREYYLPGEYCNSIMPKWWWREGDLPRPDQDVLKEFQAARAVGVNVLLDAPPDNHGLIPKETVDALMRLRRNAGL
ncbi:MAG TPA: alpha-L-fucosidase [Kiritimatiellia bacterium]|nr:alpha-L-fucosidase [Kiritimatiellia bacterium]HOM58836.1 alpha-L-fucosidase [Kiritimatiellia bacterium]HOR97917.1 alpha-L-fucosidase [Kiritimatiellia bacterium]HPC48729.1 alpha-L-fucosidase [Kiritimatiellia bacterium]HPK37648.1 alpha-L-fucosidase [Kiritimatiellia bacterium]